MSTQCGLLLHSHFLTYDCWVFGWHTYSKTPLKPKCPLWPFSPLSVETWSLFWDRSRRMLSGDTNTSHWSYGSSKLSIYLSNKGTKAGVAPAPAGSIPSNLHAQKNKGCHTQHVWHIIINMEATVYYCAVGRSEWQRCSQKYYKYNQIWEIVVTNVSSLSNYVCHLPT